MNTSPLRSGILIWLTLVSLAACGASVEDATGNDDPTGPAPDASVPDAQVITSTHCDSQTPCEPGLLCIEEQCLTPEGSCASDGECSGDTYCCIGDCLPEGHSEGACIPYGTGPRAATNPECTGDVVIGLFEATTQCEWSGPPPGDAFPEHTQVLTTPLVANLPHDSGAAAEIIIVTYNHVDGGAAAGAGTDPRYFGVIRILNGQTCAQIDSIDDPENRVIGASTPAIADLDGDGIAEIVTQRAETGLVAFSWNSGEGRYGRLWATTESDISNATRWDGPSVHDLNDDGQPEVISAGEVFDGRSGARLNPGQSTGGANRISVVGDVDADGIPDLVSHDIHSWNAAANRWDYKYPGGPNVGKAYAFADFGTAGDTPAEFDPKTLDGIAEIVVTGGSRAVLATLDGQILFELNGLHGGGPPTIGDFDSDGFPEIATAGGTAYRVFDLECATGDEAGCESPYVRWSQPSQDLSSAQTGSAIFDFEGDGKAEAVYADECFTRIYDGSDGEVLYSAFRTSCTWYENPVIADPDGDSNTEILVGSNSNCGIVCPEIDPIHRGLRCEDDGGCLSGQCDAGFCRCADSGGCDEGYECAPPPDETPGTGLTCRASHPPGVGLTGLRVLRDRLDRWASSRPLWNQHAYSVTNINDDLSVPATSEWNQNFQQSELNNYRQNQQGDTGAEDFPDITGRFDEASVCLVDGSTTTLTATVCNRGQRAVGSALPATFYAGDVQPENVLCVSFTEGPVSVGGCLEVTCAVDEQVSGLVTLVVNDDGGGNPSTVECLSDNNSHTANVSACSVVQ